MRFGNKVCFFQQILFESTLKQSQFPTEMYTTPFPHTLRKQVKEGFLLAPITLQPARMDCDISMGKK